MHTRTLLIASCLALLPLAVQGQSTITVNYMAAPGQRDVLLEANLPVPDGNYVSLGFFDAGFDPSAHADDVTELFNYWNEFGATQINTLFGQPGRFSASQSSTEPVFSSQSIWLWIFKTADNATPLPDFSNLQGYGLYTGSSTTWRFPALGTSFPDNTIDITSSGVNQALYGSFDPQHLYLRPASVVVPEPSTWTLLIPGLGALGFLARKGRRQA